MNEISYYEEFSEKFKKYLNTYFNDKADVYYACNNTLDNLVKTLEKDCGFQIKPDNVYVPKLKVDMVFAICLLNKRPRLILIEAKLLNQLSLKDYSQLIGYLQVAKIIEFGLLLLIQKNNSLRNMSNDFREIISLKKLPMKWLMTLKHTDEGFDFRTGILSYIPNNGIDWIPTREINGISSFEELFNAFNEL